MKLTDSGESRIRGYLYVLERSLRSFLSPAVVADAVREVESHIRDAVMLAGDVPDERVTLEGILERLGPPIRVAQAYSLELVMDEAATTGRLVAVLRSLLHAATTGVTAFLAAFGLFVGYSFGVAFIVVAIMKPIFPNNVGLWTRANGMPVSAGVNFPAVRRARIPHQLLDRPDCSAHRLRALASDALPRAPLDPLVSESPAMEPSASMSS